jgi:hypothetical protein
MGKNPRNNFPQPSGGRTEAVKKYLSRHFCFAHHPGIWYLGALHFILGGYDEFGQK